MLNKLNIQLDTSPLLCLTVEWSTSNISRNILVDLLCEKSTRYIKTCLEASIDHLTKFMELRLKVLY